MSILHVLSRISVRSTRMQKLVIGANAVLGVGLMLLASMAQTDSHTRFSMSPWIVPSLCVVYLCALILVHVPRSHGREDEDSVDPLAEGGPAVVSGQEKAKTSAAADVEQTPV